MRLQNVKGVFSAVIEVCNKATEEAKKGEEEEALSRMHNVCTLFLSPSPKQKCQFDIKP